MPCVVIAVPILIEALCPFSVGQLSYYAADYLKMPQLLGADVGQQPLELRIRHGIALA